MSEDFKWTPTGDYVILKGSIKKELGGSDAILRPKYIDSDFDYTIHSLSKGDQSELEVGMTVEVPSPYFNKISTEKYGETSREDRYFYVNKLDIRLVKA